jgi:hypothetical protein
MINLISPTQKERTNREYFMRLAVLALLFMFFLVLIASVFLVPSYLVANVNAKSAQDQLEMMKSHRDPEMEKISASIQSINKNLSVFTSSLDAVSVPEDILKPIIDARGTGVTFAQMLYEKKEKIGWSVTLHGSALSREEMLTFVRNLEASGKYEKINVPIGDLIKGQNVEFDLVLIKKK